jgi:hypothetical protein
MVKDGDGGGQYEVLEPGDVPMWWRNIIKKRNCKVVVRAIEVTTTASCPAATVVTGQWVETFSYSESQCSSECGKRWQNL